MIQNSYHLLKILKEAKLLPPTAPALWWPNSGTFEVVVGAILTQQTKWERVEESLQNLQHASLLNLEALAQTPPQKIAPLIRPSGFNNTKADYLHRLAEAIYQEFQTFDRFQSSVTRAWLLAQKGIGNESADAILCYGCYKPVMVVDSYTKRLLGALEIPLTEYHAIQAWFYEGVEENWERIEALYDIEVTPHRLYARFHGKIVEFAKRYIRGKEVDTSLFY